MLLPREANGTNCSSRGVHTRISKEIYSHIMIYVIFSGVHTPFPPLPLDQPMVSSMSVLDKTSIRQPQDLPRYDIQMYVYLGQTNTLYS